MIDPMLAALGADGPAPEHAGELALFGQFVGTWDVDSRRWDQDGTELAPARAVWTFGWALHGRAVIDVLEGPDVLGTTVRMPHPDRGEWTVIWHSALSQRHFVMTARQEQDRIVLRGRSDDGEEEWSFNAIEPASFLWRSRVSPDGGASWYVDQEMRATRAAQ